MTGKYLWLAPALALGVAACSSSNDGGSADVPAAGSGVPLAGASGVGTAGVGGSVIAGQGTGTGVAGTGVAGAPLAGSAGAPVAGSAGAPLAGSAGEPIAGAAGGAGTTVTGDCGAPSLQLEGLMYSPGGNVLPRGCEPFNPTTNNPYAVRCVEAWPWYTTQFAGDEYCILPPEPSMGVQTGVHPQGANWYAQVSTGDMSGYANPDNAFVMQPGEEEEINYTTSASNTEPHNYYRNYVRMRPGSHHMIVSHQNPGAPRETWSAGDPIGGLFLEGMPGAQRPDENTPKSLEKPEEDAGLFKALPANQDVIYNMHHFNPTPAPILKENWTNLWWEDDARIEVFGIFGMPLTQTFDTFAQPGQTVDKHYSWNITQDVRLLTLFGHRHAWTTNFSAWVVEPDGSTEILYQSFDWFDEPTYRYDSQTQNPAPAPDLRSDGGATGIRMLKAGEQLHFNCHLNYTDARAAEVDSPVTPTQVGTLRFANQAYNGEMCILFGSTAAVQMPQPAASTAALPSFATLD